ncbi:MAG: DDE-type integrase/transposase/recombinase [Acidobacteriota bacterium]|nr:DDE-type integrase/transposase/recombinase [Spirochaetaceae bacterium]MDE3262082.1 DDE-type integrase/transposase/recombinase [Acidobacteriota bacterium]
MGSGDAGNTQERWARLRFAVVGPLLASPPPSGQLRTELQRLAQREWEHPTGGGSVRFSVSTIERWYYQARSAENDPVGALKRRPRADAGRERAISAVLIEALREQYRTHPSWSAQLHYENLAARVEADPALGPMPSYATLTRAMRNRGLVRKRRRRRTRGGDETPVSTREVLSYEVSRSHALWHTDFHHGKRRVLTPAGEWKTPFLLGFLDDHSRLGCHLQWYLAETAEVFVHGLCQAFMKRGLPRALMSDNGSPMLAGEVAEGLHRLGIVHARTLSRAPHMNGKCEVWWALVEGRLMAMLECVEPLTLKRLNDATVSWLEQDYHRRVHRELGVTPHRRLTESPDASRPCPPSAELRDAFRIERTRTVRRSDATVSVGGVRYQLPAPWRHLRDVRVRYARWDLAGIDLVDDRTGDRLCTLYPLDKRANAAAVRRPVRSADDGEDGGAAGNEPAPLLGRILEDQAATGLAPAWLAHPDSPADDHDPGETTP